VENSDESLVHYPNVDAIYDSCPLEGMTSRERSIYINEARRTNYPTIMTGPLLTSSKPIMFSEADACVVHFPHNNALIITMHIDNGQVSRNLVDKGSSVNILYGGTLDRIDDISGVAQAMINPQTQSNLYRFDENET